MASVTVFDPVTQNTKTITIDVDMNILQEDVDGAEDYIVRLSTSARNTNTAAIPACSFRARDEFPGGDSHRFGDPGNFTPYANLTEEIEDYVLYVIDGAGSGYPMSFS